MTDRTKRAIGASTVARHELPNGVTLLVYPNPTSPSVAITGYHAASAVLETQETAGLASLTAEALNRGTTSRTFLEFSQALDDVGASLSFHADTELGSFGGRALADDLELLLTLATDGLAHPIFPEDEIVRIRDQTLAGIAYADDNPAAVAGRRFRELLYEPDNPNAWPVEGYAPSVSRFRRQDLQAFHQRAYTPQTLVLAIVGAVDPANVLDLAMATVGSWTNHRGSISLEGWHHALASADAPPHAPDGDHRREDLALAGKTQTEFVLGWLGLRRNEPQYYAAIVANYILGQMGLGGRIGSNVRDTQGLAYHATSSFESGLTRQPWTLRAGINPSNVDQAISASLHEAHKLADQPPDADELRLTKQALIGSMPLQLERNEGIANMLLALERHGLGLDFLTIFPDLVTNVRAQDVCTVIGSIMNNPGYTLVTVGPDLDTLGK